MPACFELEDVTFFYPEQPRPAIQNLSFSVQPGEFVTICGPSGCGKSTLLRQLKPVLAPHGRRTGEIFFEGKSLDFLDLRTQSAGIGFVQQSPDNQIVTDKVWHELAFGLESLGCDTKAIRGRVAEMANFFGIQTWFYKNVAELSGGQKQLLNLAAIMTMQPSVLVLDEPTSQLDPIAASDFLGTLGKINRELGTTVLITEHRLEEVLPLSDRVLVMDSGMRIADGTPQAVGEQLREIKHTMFLAMPTAMRVWAATDSKAPCPVTVRDGRRWLAGFRDFQPVSQPPAMEETPPAAMLKNVWFKYTEDSPDVVKDLNLCVPKGSFFALLGGNGTGKTTTLSLLAGLRTPYRGQVTVNGKVGFLPQNPQTIFAKKTVREDLFEILPKGSDRETKVARAVRLCRLEALLDRHPYDLSGGEQQRAALCKVLLLEPEILLLDEPTKGLDAEFKQVLAEILRMLRRHDVTVFMVSHDVEFCAEYADRCALFFDGAIVTENTPRIFFSGNSFYTTAASRMARGFLPNAVTATDLMTACGGTIPPMPVLEDDFSPLPPPAETSADWRPKPLPWWRIAGAVLSGGLSLYLFWKAMGVTDLTKLIGSTGTTTMGAAQLRLYALFLAALFIFATCVTRRSNRPDYLRQTPLEKRKLSRRAIVAAGLILLLIPLTLYFGVAVLGGKKYYFIALLILLETMLPFFLVFEGRKPQARELIVIAVLCALGVAGRAAFFALPEFKPVVAITIISGVAFGGETGFLVGSMTMLLSNVLFGQGQWTPFQMFAMGIIGFLAGVLFRKGLLRRSRQALCVFGAFCSIVIYGGIMNPVSALIWVRTLDVKTLLAYYVSGFPVDCVRAGATWLFLWFGAEPMLEKLDRIKIKYGLVE